MKNARFACREDLDAGRAFSVCAWWVVLARVRGELPDRSAVKIWKRIFEVCWRGYAVSFRTGVPGMRGWFL